MTIRRRILVGIWSTGLVLLCAERSAFAANCSISTTGLAFGTYNVFSPTPLDSTATITYSCNGNADITISLDKGGASTFATRRVLKGAEQLLYNLYPSAAYGTIWGDGTSSTFLYSRNNVPNNSAQTLTIFGRMPAGQDVTAGSYSNTVTVTINY